MKGGADVIDIVFFIMYFMAVLAEHFAVDIGWVGFLTVKASSELECVLNGAMVGHLKVIGRKIHLVYNLQIICTPFINKLVLYVNFTIFLNHYFFAFL